MKLIVCAPRFKAHSRICSQGMPNALATKPRARYRSQDMIVNRHDACLHQALDFRDKIVNEMTESRPAKPYYAEHLKITE